MRLVATLWGNKKKIKFKVPKSQNVVIRAQRVVQPLKFVKILHNVYAVILINNEIVFATEVNKRVHGSCACYLYLYKVIIAERFQAGRH